MSVVHLHLLLSHVPVIGMFGVALLLLIAFVKRSDEVARAAFGVGILLAVAAAVVFLTGEGSEHAVENLAGISDAALEAHEDAGALALWSTVGFGVLALGALVLYRRRTVARAVTGLLLVLAVAGSGVVGWTANLGGKVRHTEITNSLVTAPQSEERD